MAFDWASFLNLRHIPYVDRGPNVAAGNIAVRCPWCGHADALQHLEIALNGKGWRCWRNFAHRGRSPVRLIAALVPCSLEQAAAMAGVNVVNLPADFAASVRAKLQPVAAVPTQRTLLLPHEFRPIIRSTAARPYINYLRGRGLAENDIDGLWKRFGISFATTGEFRSRIIFPVMLDGQLQTWTGRTISPTRLPRYRTLTTDHDLAKAMGMPPALGPISDYLLFYDILRRDGADTLFIVEGPMDALKLWLLGASATCLFTTRASPAQVGFLHTLLPRYRRRILLLDRGAEAHAMRLRGQLAALDVELRWLPKGVDDPGELASLDFLR